MWVNGKASQACPGKGLSWLTMGYGLMVRAAVDKADLYVLYFPKLFSLSFSSMFCHFFPFSLLPAGTSSLVASICLDFLRTSSETNITASHHLDKSSSMIILTITGETADNLW